MDRTDSLAVDGDLLAACERPRGPRPAMRLRQGGWTRAGRRLLGGVQAIQLLLLLAVLVPVLLVQGIIYYREFEVQRETEFHANLEVARALAATFDAYVGNILRQEALLGRTLASQKAPDSEQARELLTQAARENPALRDLAWVDPRGQVVASSRSGAVGHEIGDHAYFRSVAEGREWEVSDLLPAWTDGEATFFIARGIRDGGGVLQGGVVAAVDPARLGEVFRVSGATEGTFGFLDRQRRLVYRYPPMELTWERRAAAETGVGATIAQQGVEVVGTFVSPLDGLERVNAFVPIASLGWVARAGRSEPEVMAPVSQRLLRDSGLLLAVAVVAFLAALGLGRQITLPIGRLREHALAVGRGETGRPAEVEGPSELRELAEAFNRMAWEIGVRENALAQAKESAELLYRVVPSAIYTVDREQVVTSWNDKAAELTGYTASEMIGRRCLTFALSPCAERCGLFESDAPEPLLDKECIIQRKDGQKRLISKNAGLLRDAEGNVVGGIESFEDVTDRRRMGEQLLRAQRLETAGRLAGQVAHDFNNLLAPFTVYPDLIKMQVAEDHPAARYCDAMLEAAQQMAEINGEMMTLARRGGVDQEPTDLNRLAQQAVEQMVDRPATLEVQLDLATDLRSVDGSPSQLLRVIANLLSNSRAAMQDAGTLTLRTRDLYVDHPQGHYNRVEVGEYVELSVADTGCGIPPEIRDKIFDAFFTTKKTVGRRGTGLGLTIIQAIVGDHRGHLDLESEVGRGTTFHVYFPPGLLSPAEAPSRGLPMGTESVLVVDDDPVQREALGETLRRLGYRVEMASSGEQAVSHLREHPADLLVLDIVMPLGMNGAETYRRALEVRPEQRAIILSGFAASELVREAQTLGAGAYLRKPVTVERVARAVREELDRGRSGRPSL